MIKRLNEYKKENREAMKGGDGTVKFEHIWEKGPEIHSNTRLFSRIILEPGCSIGHHVHQHEEEIFVVLEGTVKADDNGVTQILNTGDSIITRDGEGHSIACVGDRRAVVLAVIGCY